MNRKNSVGTYIYGRNSVHDALLADNAVYTIIVDEAVKSDARIMETISLAKQRGINFQIVESRRFTKYPLAENSQGIIAQAETPSNTVDGVVEAKTDPCLFLFDHIDYEQNLGSILRSCWAAQIDMVICAPNGVHTITPVVSKVSMGGASHVPLLGQSLFQSIDIIRRSAISVVGVEVGMGRSYTDEDLTGAGAFVFGGESTGLTKQLSDRCDKFIHIPINSQLASLNVAVTAALVAFERKRQLSLIK